MRRFDSLPSHGSLQRLLRRDQVAPPSERSDAFGNEFWRTAPSRSSATRVKSAERVVMKDFPPDGGNSAGALDGAAGLLVANARDTRLVRRSSVPASRKNACLPQQQDVKKNEGLDGDQSGGTPSSVCNQSGEGNGRTEESFGKYHVGSRGGRL